MRNDMPYEPVPIDTSAVQVPEELLELSEMLARNTHNIWAQQRMSEGWTYAEKLDRDAKTHPDLVEYEDLPEEEKEYDRKTSMEAIKLILACGFRIVK